MDVQRLKFGNDSFRVCWCSKQVFPRKFIAVVVAMTAQLYPELIDILTNTQKVSVEFIHSIYSFDLFSQFLQRDSLETGTGQQYNRN